MQHNLWGLTPSEFVVLELVCKGSTSQQIAAKCGRSENTVKRHISTLLNKSGASNRTELAFFAFYYHVVDCPCQRRV
jgi:DNA-binding NarL/FixJ family response regulator